MAQLWGPIRTSWARVSELMRYPTRPQHAPVAFWNLFQRTCSNCSKLVPISPALVPTCSKIFPGSCSNRKFSIGTSFFELVPTCSSGRRTCSNLFQPTCSNGLFWAQLFWDLAPSLFSAGVFGWEGGMSRRLSTHQIGEQMPEQVPDQARTSTRTNQNRLWDNNLLSNPT